MAAATSLLARRDVSGLDDLSESLAWFDALLERTAAAELADEQARGNLLDPTILIDGKKSSAIAGARIFGTVAFVDSVGPIGEAIRAADAQAEQAAPHRTGHYRASLRWFVNGSPVGGVPTAEQVGRTGNAILADLAPYASWLEVHLPNGVLFGAYTRIKRAFGRRVAIRYTYANPEHGIGPQAWPPGARRGSHPYMVPILVIGNPASTVKPGSTSRGPSGKPTNRGRPKTSSRKAGRGHRESRGIGRGPKV